MSTVIFVLLILLPYSLLRYRRISVAARLACIMGLELLLFFITSWVVQYTGFDALAWDLMLYDTLVFVIIAWHLGLLMLMWLRRRIGK